MKFDIEFCVKWNYQPEFDRVSKLIKELYPKALIIGNENQPRTGAFEVKLDNRLIFSKLKMKCFPSKEEIFKW